MRIDVLTLFPAAFNGPLDVSILGRAQREGLLDVHTHDIREHALDKHRSVDDYPYGGGQGMVLRVDVLDRALAHVRAQDAAPAHVIYLSPAGERLSDALVRELAGFERLILVCGRYEGVDERFIEHCVDREVSIGDYIVTGGELPAMVLIDAVARHIPGALGDEASSEDESFALGLLEHPQYTRPAEYQGWEVPAVLLSGGHADIEAWKQHERLSRTRARRPDLAGSEPYPDPPRPPRGAPWVRTFRYPEDFAAVRLLWESAADAIALRISDGPAEIAKKLQRDPELFLVAEYRKRIVGAVMGGFDGRRGHVYHLAVAESSRRFGVATDLMAELERRFAALGCIRMNLMVNPGNAAAETLYQGHGWTRSEASVFTKELEPDQTAPSPSGRGLG